MEDNLGAGVETEGCDWLRLVKTAEAAAEFTGSCRSSAGGLALTIVLLWRNRCSGRTSALKNKCFSLKSCKFLLCSNTTLRYHVVARLMKTGRGRAPELGERMRLPKRNKSFI